MKLLVCLAFFLSSIAFNAPVAYSMSCVTTSVKEEFKEAQFVFVGRVVTATPVSDDYFHYAVKFLIEKQWKGNVQKELMVLIAPSLYEGTPFIKGNQYLIFAYYHHQGLITGGDCGPDRPIEDAGEEIKELDRLSPAPTKEWQYPGKSLIDRSFSDFFISLLISVGLYPTLKHFRKE